MDGRSLWTLRLNGELRLIEDGPDRIVIEEGPARLAAALFAIFAAPENATVVFGTRS